MDNKQELIEELANSLSFNLGRHLHNRGDSLPYMLLDEWNYIVTKSFDDAEDRVKRNEEIRNQLTNKIFYTIDFKGHYPVGTSGIVVAQDEATARKIFDEALKQAGLFDNKETYTLNQLNNDQPGAIILQDGNY